MTEMPTIFCDHGPFLGCPGQGSYLSLPRGRVTPAGSFVCAVLYRGAPPRMFFGAGWGLGFIPRRYGRTFSVDRQEALPRLAGVSVCRQQLKGGVSGRGGECSSAQYLHLSALIPTLEAVDSRGHQLTSPKKRVYLIRVLRSTE